jgi:sugar phosphate isomerase/epimerase
MRRVWFALVLCLVTMSGPRALAQRRLPVGAEALRAVALGGIRGATIGPIESSQWPGRGYGSEQSAAVLDELSRLGATWISLTPFGRLWSLQSTHIRWDFEAPYGESRSAVRRMVEQAHARGMKVLIIPHLWVETGGWRGEIDPGSPERWDAYLSSFHAFVVGWAGVAADSGADAFSLGVECKSFSGRFGDFWSKLIRATRARFSGLLTYSANWDEVEGVLFWDQLDFVGINAFYPLAYQGAASYADYVAGAQRARDDVARIARTLDLPVVFVEVGYTTREDAAVQPWLWPEEVGRVTVDVDEQARALAAILDAFLPEPWFGGFFVWRYYAYLDDLSQEDAWGFSPHAKPAEAVLSRAWRSAWAVDPLPPPFSKY